MYVIIDYSITDGYQDMIVNALEHQMKHRLNKLIYDERKWFKYVKTLVKANVKDVYTVAGHIQQLEHRRAYVL